MVTLLFIIVITITLAVDAVVWVAVVREAVYFFVLGVR